MFLIRVFLGLSLFLCRVLGSTWNTTKTEHEKLYSAYAISNTRDYFIDTIPTRDFSQPLEVALRLEITSLGGYDAVNGAMDIIGSLSMNWTDQIDQLGNIGFDFLSVSEILVDYSKIWTPIIVLLNSADSVQRVGDSAYKVRFNLQTGQVTWKPRIIIKASCAPDVTFFPFDQQKCTLIFTPWFLKKSYVQLSVSSSAWNMENYDRNGVWDIVSTESSAFISGDYYYASFTITFNREPIYFTINVVLPILFLSLLSGFVFLLPAASGERVGFVITCFLTFVILLQTTMTYLPQASSPMSLLCYYVIVMMIFSAFLSLVNALLLRVYHKPKGETVPRWLRHVMELIKCIKCRRFICRSKNNSVEDSGSSAYENDSEKGILLKNSTYMPTNSTFNAKRLSTIEMKGKGLNKQNSKSDTEKSKGNSEIKTKSQKEESDVNVDVTGKVTQAVPKKINVEPNARPSNENIRSRNSVFAAEIKKVNPTSRKSRNKTTVIAPGLEVVSGSSASSSSNRESDELDDIDWDSVGRVLDNFFILVFIGVQCAFSLFFLVPLGSRA